MKEKYIVENNNGEIIYKPRKKNIAIGIAYGDPKICNQCDLDPLRGLRVFVTNEDFTQKLYEINPSIALDFFSLESHKKGAKK